MIRQFIISIIITIPFLCSSQQNSTFQPGKIWYDTDGNPVNAHAGGFLFHEGKYYWYGQIMIPGKRGSDAWVGVNCYSSNDLYNWKNEGVAFHVEDHASHPVTRGCKIERPKVIYNHKSKKFVMWWHHDINGQGHKNAMVGIATSNKVEGPFQFVHVFRPLPGFLPFNISRELKEASVPELAYTHVFNGGSLPADADSLQLFKRDLHTGQMARDMTLFADDDGKAYHLYASEENGTLHIAELSDDYMGYTGKYARAFSGRFMEAPTIFKSNGKYYLIASGCTGWEPNEARLAVADNIFGPWKELGNPCNGDDAETTFNSQGTFVLPVQGKKNAFIFIADRWNPANPIDGRYVWLPIQFEENRPVLRWKDEWDLNDFE
jgi:beta-xylosidase